MTGDAVNKERLLDWLEGRLDPEGAAAVAARVAASPALARSAELWRAARAGVQADDSVDPSPALLERLQSIYDAAALAGRVPALGERVRDAIDEVSRLVASVVFDGRIAATGLRGPQASVERFQLVAEAAADAGEPVELELEVERRPGGERRLLGQCSAALRRVTLLDAAGAPVATATADAGGMFELVRPAGDAGTTETTRLEAELADGRIVTLPELDLT